MQYVVPALGSSTLRIDWMPAARYQSFWPHMPAFALPSFYDGRIRINLCSRESQCRVPMARYQAIYKRISQLSHECRDSLTGEPVVESIH